MVTSDNVSVTMTQDQSLAIISTIGSVTKQYNLRDLVRSNASLLPLYYSDVRPNNYLDHIEFKL